MKLPHRRQFLHLAAGAATLPVVSRIASAQTYPARPVRIVVGFPAGGGSDITARLMGQWLSERLGQPFVVENRPGAATNIATEAVVRARGQRRRRRSKSWRTAAGYSMPGRRATEACRSRKWSLFCRQFRKIPPGGRRMSRLRRDVHAAITRCPCPATVTPRSRRQQPAGRMIDE